MDTAQYVATQRRDSFGPIGPPPLDLDIGSSFSSESSPVTPSPASRYASGHPHISFEQFSWANSPASSFYDDSRPPFSIQLTPSQIITKHESNPMAQVSAYFPDSNEHALTESVHYRPTLDGRRHSAPHVKRVSAVEHSALVLTNMHSPSHYSASWVEPELLPSPIHIWPEEVDLLGCSIAPHVTTLDRVEQDDYRQDTDSPAVLAPTDEFTSSPTGQPAINLREAFSHTSPTVQTTAARRHRNEQRQKRRRKRVTRTEEETCIARQGKFICDAPGCGKIFQRAEHHARHYKSHQPALPFRCQLTEFIGEHHCKARSKRSDNRDQHHFTHGKGGLSDNGSSGRNVHVEAEVLIQALKCTSYCDDETCNAIGPCTVPAHLADIEKKRPSRIRSQMAKYVKGDEKRATKGIATIHVEHEQMHRLGFPECLHELKALETRGRHFFRYAEKWCRDANGEWQDWRIDHNGCIFVRDVDDDGREHERCLCGPLQQQQGDYHSNQQVSEPATVSPLDLKSAAWSDMPGDF
ncbi:hypothetical protein FH972_022011 [Carpinus fangiana]|uniref:C2H2-type domain-containing protein n=1 Tax=Carpinus fangiana TaxID=176857 RepID=A0A5N6KRM5_9ROSI|nr:hypothetical protein FH972_022011 [Carpinus fangiana]